MSRDVDRWADLTTAWRSDASEPPSCRQAIRAGVRRQTLAMWLVAGMELLLTVGLVWWSSGVLAAETDAWTISLLVTLWTFWAVAVGYAYWNRRGGWRAEEETTLAYLRVSMGRARRLLRTSRFVLWLLAAEVVAVGIFWAWRDVVAPVDAESMILAIALVGMVSAVCIAWSVWAGQRARRLLAVLEDLVDELEAGRVEGGEDRP